MSKVKWLRNGEWMEKNALVIYGYHLNENYEFIENDSASSMINPIDFDHFCCVEETVEQIGENLVTFKFGETVYVSDIPLVNSIIALASEIMWDAADTICNEFGINQGENLEEVTQHPRLALV